MILKLSLNLHLIKSYVNFHQIRQYYFYRTRTASTAGVELWDYYSKTAVPIDPKATLCANWMNIIVLQYFKRWTTLLFYVGGVIQFRHLYHCVFSGRVAVQINFCQSLSFWYLTKRSEDLFLLAPSNIMCSADTLHHQ